MSEDLKALDGNALVARLAVVKERVLKESREFGMFDSDLDTEAVLDECAVRLLGGAAGQSIRESRDAYAEALGQAEGAREQRNELARENEHLRGLIRRLYNRVYEPDCCVRVKNGPGRSDGPHQPDCPWPQLVAATVTAETFNAHAREAEARVRAAPAEPVQREPLAGQVARLRGIIRAAVGFGMPRSDDETADVAECGWCFEPAPKHDPDCPWPALVAEAGKP